MEINAFSFSSLILPSFSLFLQSLLPPPLLPTPCHPYLSFCSSLASSCVFCVTFSFHSLLSCPSSPPLCYAVPLILLFTYSSHFLFLYVFLRLLLIYISLSLLLLVALLKFPRFSSCSSSSHPSYTFSLCFITPPSCPSPSPLRLLLLFPLFFFFMPHVLLFIVIVQLFLPFSPLPLRCFHIFPVLSTFFPISYLSLTFFWLPHLFHVTFFLVF